MGTSLTVVELTLSELIIISISFSPSCSLNYITSTVNLKQILCSFPFFFIYFPKESILSIDDLVRLLGILSYVVEKLGINCIDLVYLGQYVSKFIFSLLSSYETSIFGFYIIILYSNSESFSSKMLFNVYIFFWFIYCAG